MCVKVAVRNVQQTPVSKMVGDGFKAPLCVCVHVSVVCQVVLKVEKPEEAGPRGGWIAG